MNCEFKVGDMIRCITDNPFLQELTNKLGKIILIETINSMLPYKIEFLEYIGGHGGYDSKGKLGYCRWFKKKDLELYKEPILKLFLKEKSEV